MDLNFQGINSTMNIITDDVMIHGQDDSEHDRHLLQVSAEKSVSNLTLTNVNLVNPVLHFMVT